MHYQWYVPPGIRGADVGERRGIYLLSESSPRGGYLVGIHSKLYIFSFFVFKCLWEIPGEFHRYQYLPVTHCAQQYGVFVRDTWGSGIQDCAPGMGLDPLGHVNSLPIPHQAPGMWR